MIETHQLALVAKAPCLALERVGKVSPMIIHTPGDQDTENPRINMQALTVITGERHTRGYIS